MYVNIQAMGKDPVLFSGVHIHISHFLLQGNWGIWIQNLTCKCNEDIYRHSGLRKKFENCKNM